MSTVNKKAQKTLTRGKMDKDKYLIKTFSSMFSSCAPKPRRDILLYVYRSIECPGPRSLKEKGPLNALFHALISDLGKNGLKHEIVGNPSRRKTC